MIESPATTGVVNALSFDIEDWFHLVGIDSLADPAGWDALPSIVMEHTQWILQTLEEFGARATFFMLGWTADRHPELAALIAAGGHELAVHSYWHRRVDTLSREEFREDVKRTMGVLEQQAQAAVRGFRAPSFSIRPGTEWAFDELLDLGFTYDSSLFPAARDHGGYPCPRHPHLFEQTPSGRPMRELPISVMDVGPRRLAFSGGGYLRMLPLSVVRRGFRAFHERGWPVVVYLHPRDFAPDCPKAPMPAHRRFKSYVGLSTTRGKLRALLGAYRFDTCEAVLAQAPGVGAAAGRQGAAS
jgi:polysaccharide deacetylase family protein (PEP-CTERM system associated)